MVNNITNINTSHLKSLNIKKRPWHMLMEIQVLARDKQKYGRVKPVEIPTSPTW